MFSLSRRRLLASAATTVAGATFAAKLVARAAKAAEAETTILRVASRTIDVDGKAAKVFGLAQPSGVPGILTKAGRPFRVRLENLSEESTLIHWHGLLPPYGQDGVPDFPQALLPSGGAYDYDFPLETPGTHWMHAHTLQEQRLLAAPLIVEDPAEARLDEQPVVVLLHDFSFKSPEEILSELKGQQGSAVSTDHGNMPGMQMGDMQMSGMDMGRMEMDGGTAAAPKSSMPGMAMDINDLSYEAYLANDRTLNDPEIVKIEPGGTVRLRLINGATATAFWIRLGELTGEAIAVDGNPIAPVSGRDFPIGMGQRIDIRIRLPKSGGAWPVLAQREGAVERTGIVLATTRGAVARLTPAADQASPALDLAFETGLRAVRPLPEKEPDLRESLVLGGDMAKYVWTLNGRTWPQHKPLDVRAGQRVEVALRNDSMMGHPMHIHGHHFQVVAVDGKRLSGAIRDTVWVPPMRTVTLAFDAVNPGKWAFHCHHLYHMASGMMTSVEYVA
ncbi:multicopper oxidase family protein [Dongia sp.]|uniref:multicopper oxidase family protein n=1 Tax=Dongia sp. TaxID=1977262 RepID=UPI0037525844